ncbi:MAG: hypothetical protein IJ150_03755 [Bacteroidales bacterium]|nr:hypothetical protein [Bacteroidales bacterium]
MAKAAAAAEKRRIREQNQRIRESIRIQNQLEREEHRRVAAMNRYYAQVERENLRRIKQEEMAQKRAERERQKAMRDEEKARIRAEKEQAKAEKLLAKQLAQEQLEAEMSEIESDNYNWTNAHRLIDNIETEEEINEAIKKCELEQQDLDSTNCMFEKPKPTKSTVEFLAQSEAKKIYDVWNAQISFKQAEEKCRRLTEFTIPEPSVGLEDFNIPEPTKRDACDMLLKEAESKITAFFPWKQKRMRQEYVKEHLEDQFDNIHDEWEKLKEEFLAHKTQAHTEWKKQKKDYEVFKSNANNEYLVKKAELDKITKEQADYIEQRTNEILNESIKQWKQERDNYYDQLRNGLQDILSGDKDYIIAAVNDLFPNDDLDMEYFVDIAYDEPNGRMLVDLDLPEIEDIPQQKITLTPSGKKSIRQKTQTDLRSDYANCVFGLAMYVAANIFNISLKINEIEVSAYTQRKSENSALATDQYIFLAIFDRKNFSQIDFQSHTSLEIMEVFRHNYNMTKTFDMKEIDLASAYKKMETFTPATVDDLI